MGLWDLWVKRTHFIELTINSYSHRLSAFALGHLDIRNIRAKGEEVAIGQQRKKKIYIYIHNISLIGCNLPCIMCIKWFIQRSGTGNIFTYTYTDI